MFRQIYEMINSDHHFGKGIEVEVLKGFYQHIPFYNIVKSSYRKIRLSGYNKQSNTNK